MLSFKNKTQEKISVIIFSSYISNYLIIINNCVLYGGKAKNIKFEFYFMLSFLFYHVFCLSWEDVINFNHVLSFHINIFQFKKNMK